MSHFSKTEAIRRIRKLAQEHKRRMHYPNNYRTEIGRRTRPIATPTQPGQRECYRDDDDLLDFIEVGWIDADHYPDVVAHGAVVHIYVSSTGPWGELESISVGWIGTPEEDPVLIDIDGCPVDR